MYSRDLYSISEWPGLIWRDLTPFLNMRRRRRSQFVKQMAAEKGVSVEEMCAAIGRMERALQHAGAPSRGDL